MRTTGFIKAAGAAGLAGALLLAAGCSQMAPDPAAEAVAKLAYQDLIDGKDQALEALLVPADRGPNDAKTFAMMRGLLPPGAPTSATQTNWRVYAGTGGRTMTYEHTYAYPGRSVTATSVLVPANTKDGWMLRSFNVNAQITAAPAPPAAAAAPAKKAGG